MSRLFLLSALALALAACSGSSPAAPGGSAARGETVAGLTADQVAELRQIGTPILVPRRLGDFAVDGFLADGSVGQGGYSIAYRRPDGVCFEINGATDGLGGPAYPIVEMDVTLPSVGQRSRIYKASEDANATSAQNWGPGTVISEPVDAGGMIVTFLSASVGECRPMSLEEAGPIFASLVLLDGTTMPPTSRAPVTRSTASDSELWGDASDVLDVIDSVAGEDPETAAFAAFSTDEEGTQVNVETLSQSNGSAMILVTMLGLADDAVRDERFRVEYEEGEQGYWRAVAVQRQVRCWPGRGHQSWGPEVCL